MKTIEQQIIEKQDELIVILTSERYKLKTYLGLCGQLTDLKAQLKEQEEKPVYDENYLNDCIKKAKPNLSKIKDVDKHLDEIRGTEPVTEITDSDIEQWAEEADLGFGTAYEWRKEGAIIGAKAMRNGLIKHT